MTDSDLKLVKLAHLKAAFAENEIPWPKAHNLYWDPTGPLINYVGGTLHVCDLNPEQEIRWRMSRMEMFKLGLRCIKAAFIKEYRA
jgi:hypothetical protein